jgi:hypothetical protein
LRKPSVEFGVLIHDVVQVVLESGIVILFFQLGRFAAGDAEGLSRRGRIGVRRRQPGCRFSAPRAFT